MRVRLKSVIQALKLHNIVYDVGCRPSIHHYALFLHIGRRSHIPLVLCLEEIVLYVTVLFLHNFWGAISSPVPIFSCTRILGVCYFCRSHTILFWCTFLPCGLLLHTCSMLDWHLHPFSCWCMLWWSSSFFQVCLHHVF